MGTLRSLRRHGQRLNGSDGDDADDAIRIPIPGDIVIVSGKFNEAEIGAPVVHLAAIVAEVLPDLRVSTVSFTGTGFRSTHAFPGPGGRPMPAPPVLPVDVVHYSREPLPGTWRYPHEHPWPTTGRGTTEHQLGRDRHLTGPDEGTPIGPPDGEAA